MLGSRPDRIFVKRSDLNKNFFWSHTEVPKKRWAQPSLHIELRRVVPVAAAVGPPPFQPELVARELRRCEDHSKALFGIRDIRNGSIDHRVSTGYKRLLRQAYPRIIEDPHPEVPVWRYDIDSVHPVDPAHT
jgi:hypothetical protein